MRPSVILSMEKSSSVPSIPQLLEPPAVNTSHSTDDVHQKGSPQPVAIPTLRAVSSPWREVKNTILRKLGSRWRDSREDGSRETMTISVDSATGGRTLTLSSLTPLASRRSMRQALSTSPLHPRPQQRSPPQHRPLLQQRSPPQHRPLLQQRSPQQPQQPQQPQSYYLSVPPTVDTAKDVGQTGSRLEVAAPSLAGQAAATSSSLNQSSESNVFSTINRAQDQLDALIKARGYHVKEHVPKKVLEDQIMENIQRREMIARILKQEPVPDSPGHPVPRVSPSPRRRTHNVQREDQMMSLLTKLDTVEDRMDVGALNGLQ